MVNFKVLNANASAGPASESAECKCLRTTEKIERRTGTGEAPWKVALTWRAGRSWSRRAPNKTRVTL